jgi:hypothetical protein
MSEDSVFAGPWLIEYTDEGGTPGNILRSYITANYKAYDEEQIIKILNEVHPEWTIKNLYKVEKLPWLA